MGSLAAFTKGVAKIKDEMVYDPSRRVDFIPTGNVIFDAVAGGGLPRGRITEVFGMEGSGKTAIFQTLIGNNPKLTGVYFDFEHSWHNEYAKRNYGIKIGDRFQVYQPMCLEEGADLLDDMDAAVDELDFVFFDSVDAMKPRQLIEHKLDKDGAVQPGLHARGVSAMVAKCLGLAARRNAAVGFINQMRSSFGGSKFSPNVGVGAGFNSMDTYTTTGGHALRFYAGLRMKMEHGRKFNVEKTADVIMGGETPRVRVGHEVKMINVKNKVATPYRQGLSHFYYPTDEQPGGFSAPRDRMLILRNRGRLRSVGKKLIYDGLDLPGWEKSAGKEANELAWCESREVQEDARKLIQILGGVVSGIGTGQAVAGVDFDASDVEGDDTRPSLMSGGGFPGSEYLSPSETTLDG